MKALLVTSRVHFVPDNYDTVVLGLSECPHIGGLLILDNLDVGLLKTTVGLWFWGARRLGGQLVKNILSGSTERRYRAYREAHKPVWMLPSINTSDAKQLIAKEGFDLIINARTRMKYDNEVLRLPSHGCINIHHGLLPEQRGVLCDLWSLSEGAPAGFSLHYMTEAIDSGTILRREIMDEGTERDFITYLSRSAQRECAIIKEVLNELGSSQKIPLIPNERSDAVHYRRTPNRHEIRAMIKKGIVL